MKTKKVLVAFLIVVAVLLANVSSTFAQPPLPSGFYGTVKLNGANVPDGTVVSAWINGVKFAESTVQLYQGDTVFNLDVPGDDAGTDGVIEGGASSDTVSFHIGNLVAAQTHAWASGTNIPYPLTASTTTAGLAFVSGWNFITLPLRPMNTFTAHSLLQAINGATSTCSEVDRWYRNKWSAHYYNDELTNNYDILMGVGYFVYCSGTRSWNMEGQSLTAGISLSLVSGWNSIGVPYPSGHTAHTVMDGINGAGGTCSEIDQWWHNTWSAHYYADPATNDFNLDPNKGYFVRCSSNVTYTP
jgi:hypothetical protein